MNIYQFMLSSISAIFFTLGCFFLARTIYVYKKFDRYFFFAITNFFGSFFVLAGLILSFPHEDSFILTIHRLRLLALIICITSWFYCLYDMYLTKDYFIKIYASLSFIIALTIPTRLFVSYPIQHHFVEISKFRFDYRYATGNFFYFFFAILMLLFALITAIRIFKSQNKKTNKIIGIITLSPIFSGINDFSVTSGLIDGIFLSEYLTFIFVLSITFVFLKEELQKKNSIILMNESLLAFNEQVGDLKNYLFNILESIPSILVSVDKDYKITQWNSAAERITGKKTNTTINNILWDVIPELGEFKEEIEKTITNNRVSTLLRKKLFEKDKLFNITLFPLKGNKAGDLGIIAEDITEIEQKEIQLRQAQKMETIGNLAGGLAHDFNNALSGIIGPVTLLKYKMNNKNELDLVFFEKNLNTIFDSAHRASDMVMHLLSLSRKTETSYSPLDLQGSLKYILKVCKSTFDKRIDIETDLISGVAAIEADSTQIGQVLLNLCVNASHAMTIMRPDNQEQGGKLSITMDKFIPDSNFLKKHAEAKDIIYWVINIRDTGIGIPKDVLSKIWDPFYTTKDKGTGTGLGLTMVYNIVHQHKGFIDVYSEEGIGTSFSLYFPAYKNTEIIDIEKDKQIFSGEGYILIIDDDMSVRYSAQMILYECGYDVIIARDGLEGIQVYNQNKDLIRAVLLDISMPKMSGKDVFANLKSINPEVRVLLSSGFRQDERIVDLIKNGDCKFIKKPYTLYQLSKAIYEILK